MSSPKPDLKPVSTGEPKKRTGNLNGKKGKDDFRDMIRAEKSARQKDSVREPGDRVQARNPAADRSDGGGRAKKGGLSPDAERSSLLPGKKSNKTDILNSLARPGKSGGDGKERIRPSVGERTETAVPDPVLLSAVQEPATAEAASEAGEPISRDNALKTGNDNSPASASHADKGGDPVRELPAGFFDKNGGAGSDGSSRENRFSGRRKSAVRSLRTGGKGDGPSVTVEDRRTPDPQEQTALFRSGEKDSSADLTLELAPGDGPAGMTAVPETHDTTSRFVMHAAEEQKGAALLDRQLQNGGTRELAKNIHFVLKDKNQGEIKLILKPEALGKVRIHLNLQENNIVGKIIVENNSVRQVFLDNLPDLSKALEESGFQNASLDVSVGGGQTGQHRQSGDERPVYFQGGAEELDDQVPVRYEETSSLSQIDLVI